MLRAPELLLFFFFLNPLLCAFGYRTLCSTSSRVVCCAWTAVCASSSAATPHPPLIFQTDKVRRSAEVACRAEESVKRQRAEGREREITGCVAAKGPAEGAVRDLAQGGVAAGWEYQGYQGYQPRQGNWW